ncbi:MAG: hypothetical protein ABI873_13570 [Marmoricola sp.]
MVGILIAVIGGTVIGVLGHQLSHDEDSAPLLAVIIGGIGGMLLSDVLYNAVWHEPHSSSTDWWRHTSQILITVIVVLLITRKGRI